jgi:hypothetical protein
MIEMNFYWWKENGKIIVQNMIMGLKGQKHEHTPEDFEQWKKDIPAKNLTQIKCSRKLIN